MTAFVEVEARWLDLDQVEIEKKLSELGATKTGEYFFKEWIFQKEEWREKNRRIRVRSDGTKSWLTYKANASWAVDSTEEVEFEISSPENAAKFVEVIGVPLVRYQEKKRHSYKLGTLTVELDFWPQIPMVVEIEGSSEEEVREGAQKLGVAWEKAVFEDQMWVHIKYYNLDLRQMKEYKFATS